MSEVTYKVTLPYNFIAESRTRGGITVPREGGYEGPLTAEQYEAISNDPIFTVEGEAPDDEKPLTKKELLEAAGAEGLALEVTVDNKRDEILAAIDAARAARD